MSNQSFLRDLVSSSLKRQNLTATVPAAMRFIPLGALVAGELLGRHTGSAAVTDTLLGKDQPENVLILGGMEEMFSESKGRREVGPGIVSCGICSGGPALQRSLEHSKQSMALRVMSGTAVLDGFPTCSKKIQLGEIERINS